MIEYKCPYCGQDTYSNKYGTDLAHRIGKYVDWLAVKVHSKNCKKSDKSYIICEYYGPILISNISNYKSVEHFTYYYPLNTLNFKSLRKHYPTFKLRTVVWDKESCIEAIQDFYEEYERIPEIRDFKGSYSIYPSYTTVIKYCGSWNTAIENAGFIVNGSKGFGVKTIAKDSVLYRSLAEAYFVDNYLYGKYSYDYEIKYPGLNWRYDFYIKELFLYTELTGGLRPERIQQKIDYNKLHNINFKLIKNHNLKTHSGDLEKLLSLSE